MGVLGISSSHARPDGIAWASDRQRFTETGLYSLVPPTPLLWPEHSWAYFKDLEPLMGFDLKWETQNWET